MANVVSSRWPQHLAIKAIYVYYVSACTYPVVVLVDNEHVHQRDIIRSPQWMLVVFGFVSVACRSPTPGG